MTSYGTLATSAAQKYGVPVQIVNAVIQQESGGNPNAKSGAGAVGLMQLMPSTAKTLGVNPNDPKQNIEGGTKYLAQLHNQFGSWDKALAAYNAGPGNVQKYGGIPPFQETQNYVKSVMNKAQIGGGSVSTAPLLTYGSTGSAVKQLQQKLGISADGIYGPQTQNAVRQYQQSHGLSVDGVVGSQTWGSLLKPAPTTTAPKPAPTSTTPKTSPSPTNSGIDPNNPPQWFVDYANQQGQQNQQFTDAVNQLTNQTTQSLQGLGNSLGGFTSSLGGQIASQGNQYQQQNQAFQTMLQGYMDTSNSNQMRMQQAFNNMQQKQLNQPLNMYTPQQNVNKAQQQVQQVMPVNQTTLSQQQQNYQNAIGRQLAMNLWNGRIRRS